MKYDLELQSVEVNDITVQLLIPREECVKKVYREQKERNAQTPFPYWARIWPSAIALSAFIQQHCTYVADQDVLELAAGLGLPSLLAARYARRVCCSDYLSEALDVVNLSIKHYGATNITTRLLDWHRLPSELAPDVLLLSDVNYEPQEFEVLYKVLTGFLEKNASILLSTPQRLMAKPFIERLLPWCMHQEEYPVRYRGEETLVSVFVLKGSR